MRGNNLKFDAIVIGGGIAGLQAAIDLGDQGYQVAIVEKKSLNWWKHDKTIKGISHP